MAYHYVIDGIYYEEYPDAEERIAALREDRDEWKRLAIEGVKDERGMALRPRLWPQAR